MPETSTTGQVRPNYSAGHISVHVEGDHPVEIPFFFEQQRKRIGPAAVASFASHVAMFVLAVLAVRYSANTTHAAPVLPEKPNHDNHWLSQPGPGGGGGGGGNRMKEPPKQAEDPGKDKITVPVQKPPKLEMQQAKVEPNPIDQLNIPAKSLAAATESL